MTEKQYRQVFKLKSNESAMVRDFIIYPEGIQKLEKVGLLKKIQQKAKKLDLFSEFTHHLMKDEVVRDVNEMKEKGYFKNIPAELKKEFNERLQTLFKEPGKQQWKITKEGKDRTEEASLEDVLLLAGYPASLALSKKGFWEYKKAGFDDPYSFLGLVGACFLDETGKKMSSMDRGYTYSSKTKEGLEFLTEISGSMHGDLRINRTDLTQYETRDPLGNKTLYRPKSRIDDTWVSGYHSTEEALLAGLMKYAEHEKITSEILKNKEAFVKSIQNQGQMVGNFADFGMGSMGGARTHFIGFNKPLMRFDKNKKEDDRCMNYIFVESGGVYGMYVGTDGNLVFSYSSRENLHDLTKKREINMSIPREELDEMIRGVFIQASRGLGRTSVKQLVNVLMFPESKEYKEGRKEHYDI